MPLTPSQLAWANGQVGTDRAVAHTGTITKVGAKGDGWVATVVDEDKMAATFELDTDKATADEHVGVETTVLVEGDVAKVIDNDDGFVTFEIVAPNGKVYDRVHPPAMTDAEREERFPTPTPEEQAAAEAQAQADQEAAAAERDTADRNALKEHLLRLLADDVDVQAAVRAVP